MECGVRWAWRNYAAALASGDARLAPRTAPVSNRATLFVFFIEVTSFELVHQTYRRPSRKSIPNTTKGAYPLLFDVLLKLGIFAPISPAELPATPFAVVLFGFLTPNLTPSPLFDPRTKPNKSFENHL